MAVKFVEFIPRLEAAIDGPWRVESYKAAVHPACVGRGAHKVHLFTHSGFAIFGPKESLHSPMNRFNPTHRGDIQKSLRFLVFQSDKETLRAVDSFAPSGSQVGFFAGKSFEECFSQVETYVDILRKLSEDSGLFRPMNKKFDVITLFLQGDEFHDGSLMERMLSLLEDANRLRVQFLFLAEDPRSLPDAIEDKVSWQLFLGKSNIEFCEEAYGLETVHSNYKKQQMGVILDKENSPEYLLYAYDFGAEDTDYMKEVKNAEKSERDSYLDFLDSLVSGD